MCAKVVKVAADTLARSRPAWWLTARLHLNGGGDAAAALDPARRGLGPLLALSDDVIQPQAGSRPHAHSDVEMFSYVVDGAISHEHSQLGGHVPGHTRAPQPLHAHNPDHGINGINGHSRGGFGDSWSHWGGRGLGGGAVGHGEAAGEACETLRRGCVQFVSGGTGVRHAEVNHGSECCRVLHVCLAPDHRGHTPRCGHVRYGWEDRHNRLLQIVAGAESRATWPGVSHPPVQVKLHQDAHAFVSESDPGVRHRLVLGPGRQAYVLCMEGELLLNGSTLLTASDGARVLAPPACGPDSVLALEARGRAGAHFMVLELPQGPQQAGQVQGQSEERH
ncbi:hypothetical protein HYH03_001614 [Edaphochlamys debaryana]|uniref:Quercetin 2,3-dioxygenase C-terminal cupin domain-containing protein n=1 Tax=Edaphochlamys debaryana TaxID=47281 RepID=A0A835YDS5_9CHLO|nr:hypothetical protein HYH03_001614 [Edaphochlamys debaryana]|eukprot:KAG2500853.1 hypothetical protein HYH03_001614 [Edaphochlamys debaryana]